jgi:hypothetical protein
MPYLCEECHTPIVAIVQGGAIVGWSHVQRGRDDEHEAWTRDDGEEEAQQAEFAAPNVQAALVAVEQAQRKLLDAAEALSSVRGFSREWQAVCAAHEASKKLWHRINRKAQQRK